MDFIALLTMGTEMHYITMPRADWSISTSHGPLPSSCHSERCYGIHPYRICVYGTCVYMGSVWGSTYMDVRISHCYEYYLVIATTCALVSIQGMYLLPRKIHIL